MKNYSLSVALLCGVILLGGCSRTETGNTVNGATPEGQAAAATATATATPTATNAATNAANAATGTVKPAGIAREVPPEDRLEPVAIDQAKLPGGAAMPGNPVESTITHKKTAR